MQVIFWGGGTAKEQRRGARRAKEEGKGHIDEVNIERDWDFVLPGALWLAFQTPFSMVYLWELDWLLSPSAPESISWGLPVS